MPRVTKGVVEPRAVAGAEIGASEQCRDLRAQNVVDARAARCSLLER